VENCGKAGQANDDNIMWSVSIACWKTKATNTHSDIIIIIIIIIIIKSIVPSKNIGCL
jgi:hypothetical protein